MADELWSVRLPTGVIRRGTLDDLDAAFDAGHIDENVLVLAPNATAWARLGSLAGLDANDPPPAPAAAPYVAPNSIRPMTTDLDDLAFDRPPRGKAGIVIGLLAVAVVGAGGTVFAITKLGGMSSPESLPVAAAVAAKPPTPTPPVVEPPVVQAPRLTEEQKQTVLANDAKRAKLQDEKKKSRDEAAAAAARRHHTAQPQIEFGPRKAKAAGACGCVHGDPLCTC